MTSWLAMGIVAILCAIQGFTLFTTSALGRHIMSTQQTIDIIVATLAKAKSEIVNEISKLNEQIAAAGVTEQVDTSALEAMAQSLDDIVPDAPVDAPVDPAA